MALSEAQQQAQKAASYSFCNLRRKGIPPFVLQPGSDACNFARSVESAEPVPDAQKQAQEIVNTVYEICKTCPVLLTSLGVHNTSLDTLLSIDSN